MSLIDKTFNLNSCRICLDSQCQNMVLINEENELFSLYEYCFGLTLTIEDQPRLLCEQCANNVKLYSEFKQQCLKSDSLWKSACVDVKWHTNNTIPLEEVTHESLEHNAQNTGNDNDGVQSKYETIKKSLDSNSHFLNDEDRKDMNSVEMEHTVIKEECPEDGRKLITIDMEEESVEDCNLNASPISFDAIIKITLIKIDVTPEMLEVKQEINSVKLEISPSESPSPSPNNELGINELNTHESVNTAEYNYLEEISNEKSKTKYSRIFQCEICKRKYGSEAWHRKHVKTCRAQRVKYRSPIQQNDNFNYDTKPGLKMFIKKSVMINKYQNSENSIILLCGLCKLTFTSTSDTFNHVNEHWSSNNLECKLCDFVGSDVAAIAAHRYSHSPSKHKSRYCCHICEKRHFSSVALQFHYRQDHLKKNGGLCSVCKKEFTKIRTWMKHEKTHTAAAYICDICGQSFLYKYLIRDHMMGHEGLSKSICHLCGKIFKRSIYLKLHLKSVHSETGPVNCSHCNKMFRSPHTLQVHQKIIAKEKKFKCQYCSKEYHSAAFLKAHLVMHSEERPYRCDICGRSYKAKCHLKVHMFKHTGFMPHICDVCKRPFATSTQLKVHSSVHTGVRAHRCLHCDRTFHTKKLVADHCARRHKMAETNEFENETSQKC